MVAPLALASLIAERVSAVSPDCDTAITMSCSEIIGFLYLNSDAYSTSTGIRTRSSIKYSATKPACQEVPQATIMIRSAFKNFFSYWLSPPILIVFLSTNKRPLRVSKIDLGCSFTSFSIKCS